MHCFVIYLRTEQHKVCVQISKKDLHRNERIPEIPHVH